MNHREDGEFGEGATMTMENEPIGQVSDAVIREMLAGLEGVTPGPWAVYDGCSWRRIGTVTGRYDDCAVLYPTIASDGHPDLSSRSGDREANLAHLARCDPDTMRQVLTLALEALTRRTASSVGVKSLEWEWEDFRSVWKAPSVLGEYTVWTISGYTCFKRQEWDAGKGCGSSDADGFASAQADFNTRILSALEPLPSHAGEDDGAVALIDQAMDCAAWPSWLGDVVELTNQASDAADMSTEQAVAYGILQALRHPSPSVPPQGETIEDAVIAVATLYGNYIPGHGWAGFGPTPDQIAAALASQTQGEGAPDRDSPTVVIGYTNWRGEYAEREIVPMRPWFGSTEWHKEPQWLLTAWDVAKDAERDFAIKDIGFLTPSPTLEPSDAEVEFPSLKDAYAAAVAAAQIFDDAANVEETNWTGWGEQTVPFSAEMRRVKAGQAVKALRDADPHMFALIASRQTSGERV